MQEQMIYQPSKLTILKLLKAYYNVFLATF